MSKLPAYVFNKALMPELQRRVAQTCLSIGPVGELQQNVEGTEQAWKCSNNFGDLFAFSTSELNESNAWHLEAGTFCIIWGPPAPRAKGAEVIEATRILQREISALEGTSLWQLSGYP